MQHSVTRTHCHTFPRKRFVTLSHTIAASRGLMKLLCVVSVSYTHLRAHETDTSLFVGSVRCVIRDRCDTNTLSHFPAQTFCHAFPHNRCLTRPYETTLCSVCLLYTSDAADE